jgi:hypothetical protein
MLSLSFKIIIITCCWILNAHVTFVLSSNVRENSLAFFFSSSLSPPSRFFFRCMYVCVCVCVCRFFHHYNMLMMTTTTTIKDHKYLAYLRSHSHVIKTDTSLNRHEKRRYHMSMIFLLTCTKTTHLKKTKQRPSSADYRIHTVIRQVTCIT